MPPFVFAVALLFSCAERRDEPADPADPLPIALERLLLAMDASPFVAGEAVVNAPAVTQFYAARNGDPAWRLALDRNEAMDELRRSEDDGLRASDYHLAAIARLQGDVRAARAAEADVLLTDGMLLLASHLAAGKVGRDGGARWDVAERDERLLQEALASHQLNRRFALLRAGHGEEYGRLHQALALVRLEATRMEDVRVRALRASLERQRWRSSTVSPRRVEVDVAAFRLTLHEPDSSLSLRVLVGTSSWGTPVVSSKISSIVLNPTWTVPPRILEEELIHRIRADPEWLAREGFRVYRRGIEVRPSPKDWKGRPSELPFTLVQQPGPGNALGAVKFVFYNSQNVYLHDTPQKGLFSREDRAFTHGCIRVERAVELASRLLRMDAAEIDALAADGETRLLRLDPPVPIELSYATARVEDGVLTLRKDLYGLDAPLLDALDATASARPGESRVW